ncbi:Bestrophin, RFP-TM, chloride channel-domain-containing protein [Ephemerocybe angulata]|uniref:Bestrophin, RFP-TM, chloride channel-domain-containing protein n=1 Tax=Ephemerocybe angulata TaxID=980116 RepID=A0A8H6HMS8_9AGAR|nr:Bestrophin, RFP-TM, chloride channel-domain-containing protein [Tulosesus angulatus]
MVYYDPLFRGRWTLRRLRSTILSDIWPEMIFFTLFATLITLLTMKGGHNLAISRDLLTVGGTVLAFVISFRTSSAYERFQDGSKMWANICTASRNLAQQIWIHVPEDRVLPEKDPIPRLHVIIEKKTMINLIHAFAVSVKHLLRDEPGVFYEDLYPSVSFLPKYPTSIHEPADIMPLWHIRGGHHTAPAALRRRSTLFKMVEGKRPALKPASYRPEESIYDYLPVLRLPRWTWKRAMEKVRLLAKEDDDEEAPEEEAPKKIKRKRIAYSTVVESTVPVELYLVLSNYTAYLMQNNQIVNNAISGAMVNSLMQLHEALGQLDRICNNPLPFAYQAHLRMTAWLYIIFLPFQIVDVFKYWTILATFFVATLLCGFLELGQEIENPFNYGLNDLDLDKFCDEILKELRQITAVPCIEPSEFIFGSNSQPLAPHDRRSAQELVTKSEYIGPGRSPLTDMDGLRRTLVRNWAEVDRVTRK